MACKLILLRIALRGEFGDVIDNLTKDSAGYDNIRDGTSRYNGNWVRYVNVHIFNTSQFDGGIIKRMVKGINIFYFKM